MLLKTWKFTRPKLGFDYKSFFNLRRLIMKILRRVFLFIFLLIFDSFSKFILKFKRHLPILVTSDLDILNEVFIKQYANFSARKVKRFFDRLF